MSIFFAALVLSASAEPAPAMDPNIYYCSFMATNKDENTAVDLVMIRHPKTETSGETWVLRWADEPESDALAFDIDFGSHGGSKGLQWKNEANELKRGFISFSDLIAKSGSLGLWFGLNKPSLWRAPGYGCETDIKMLGGTPK